MRITGIYLVLHVASQSAYIGGSRNCLNRLGWHRATLKTWGIRSPKLQKLWNETKGQGWIFAVVEVMPSTRSKKTLLDREQYWIDTWWGTVLNEKKRADGSGYAWSEQTKLKMSVSAKRAANTPAQKRYRSERAKRQHAEGRLGRSTWKTSMTKNGEGKPRSLYKPETAY